MPSWAGCLLWRMADIAYFGTGLMQNLVSMELDGNSLEGTLPNGLAAMKSLKLMDLSSNYLSGTLPADWTGSPRLTLLLLGNNLLTGKGGKLIIIITPFPAESRGFSVPKDTYLEPPAKEQPSHSETGLYIAILHLCVKTGKDGRELLKAAATNLVLSGCGTGV